MERKFLEDMGLDKDQVNSIMKQYGEDINSLKNEVTTLTGERDTAVTERDSYKNQNDDVTKQLKELQAKYKDNEDASATIENLEKQLKDAKKQAQTDVFNLKKNNAITNAIKDANAQDVKAVMPYLDTEKIKYDDNGLNGLSDQLDALKADKPFLFRQEQKQGVQATTGQPTPGDNTPHVDLAHATYQELVNLKNSNPSAFNQAMQNK